MKKRLLGLVIITIIAVLALVGCDNLIVDIKPEQYTVTFDVDGGSPVAPIKVNEDGFVTKPEDPTKEGFDFAGWYKDAARTEAWVFNYHKIKSDTTLYAKWVDHVHVGGTATCEDSAVCSVCGESYGTALGHTPVTDKAVAPTCGKDGLTEGSHCDVCGKVIVAQEAVPATGSHAWGEWVTDKEATEDADGAKHRDCSVCGAKEEGTIPSLTHQHSYESKVTTAPGCETKGVMTFTCKCDDSYTEEIPATGHTAGEAVVENEVAADCTTAGSYDTVVYCESCDAELSRETTTVDPVDHVDEDGDFKCDYECGAIVEPEADSVLTVEEAEALAALFAHDKYTTNKYYIVCVIDNVYNTTFGNINVKDSDFVIYGLYSYDGKIRYDAMTTKPGKGDEITVYGVIGKYNTTLQMKNAWLDDFIVHEHNYSDATCEAPATCSICGATTGDLADHDYVDGTCSVCGKVEGAVVTEIVFEFGNKGSAAHVDGDDLGKTKSYTVEGYTLNLTGMEKVYGGAYDAKGNSCIKLGTSSVTAKLSFTVPDNVVSVTINIAKYKANTTKITVNGTAYTLTKNSNDGQYDAIVVDTSSNKTVSLATVSGGVRAMINSIVFHLGETEPECEHEGGEATCENKAVCDLCGEEYGELAVHVKGEVVVENNVAPDCENTGSYDNVVYCSVCGEELSRTPVEVAALGHSEEVVSGKAATCTETGLTDGKKCSVCDEVIVAQEVINALGHTEVVDAKVDATCTKTGLTKGKHCSVCNVVLVEQTTVPTIPHTYDDIYDAECNKCGFIRDAACAHTTKETIPGTAATCTTAGLTDGEKCSKCGEILVAQEVINALGHTEVVDAKVDATCTTTGKTEGKHCSVCNEVLVAQSVVDALGHTEAVDAAVAATCTTAGKTEGKHCSVCNEVLVAQSVVDALGHTEAVDAAVAATCTTAGKTEGKHCSVCKEVLTAQEEVPALGHADENGDYLCDNGCSTKMLPEADSTLTLAQAIAVAKAMGNTYTTDKYYITCEIKSVYNVEYGNMNVKDAETDQFIVYGLYTWDKAVRYDKMNYKPVTGDEITVYGVLGCYKGTPQMKDAWLDEVVAHEHDWSHEATCDNPATCNICDARNEIAHTESTNDLTCSTPIICTVCKNELETADHVDENENAMCDVCKTEVPLVTNTAVANFEFGANGTATHNDGSDIGTSKSYTVGSYTLALTGASKVYASARDAKGNSCIKLGTGDVTAKLTFTVPDDVTSVVINIAKYKAKNSKVNINGKEYTLTKSSNDGQYDVITVDTSTTKTITLATIANNSRAMINTIVFYSSTETGHSHNQATREEGRVESTCTVAGHYDLVTYCSDEDCGKEISRTRVELELADHSYNTVVTKPTCTEDGYTTYTCSVCGHNYEDDVVGSLGHKEETISAVAPTCTKDGLSEGKKCSVCGTVTKEQEVVETEGHKYDSVVTNPTCTAGGYTTYTCSVCDHSYKDDPVDSLGHNEVAHDAKAATCTEAGHKAYVTCSRCNYTTYEEVAKLGHNLVDVAEKKATCTEAGYSAHKDCSRCDYIEGKEDYAALGHDWKDATCEAPKTCGTCGATEGEKLGHTEVTDAAVAATCTATGLTEGSHCSVCDKVLKAQEVVPVIPHTTTQHEGKAATCTDVGYEAYETCSKCDYTTYKEIAKLGHNEVAHDAKDPTCTEVGNKAYVTCSRCNYTTYEEIPAQGHSANETNHCSVCGVNLCTSHKLEVVPGKAATCITTGLTDGERCSVCGDITKAQYVIEIDSTAHKWNEGTVTTNPTCTTAGEKTFTCQHNSAHTKAEEVAKLDHDLVDVAEKKATCTVDGYTAHTKCSRCDHIEGKEVIPATGHAWNDATCEAPKTCGTCGTTEGEKLGHTEVTDAAVAATCTTTGKTEGSHCSVCGEVLVAQTVVPALNHRIENVPKLNPTCTEEGHTAYQECVREGCDYETFSAVIPATDHAWDNACDTICNNGCGHTREITHDYEYEVTDPTCTEDGYTTYTCSVCGDSYNKPGAGALDHDIVTDAAVSATCTKTGLTEGSHCSRCDDMTVAQETVPAINHKDKVHNDAVSATCTLTGTVEHWACPDCGNNFSDEACTAKIENIITETNPDNHVNTTEREETPATCTVNGYTAGTQCDACETWISGHEEIVASHDLKDVEAQDATCTEDGYTAHKACDREGCDYTEGKETIAAEGHKDEDASGRCDVCNTRNSEEGVNVTFEFGANGTASHNDGSSKTSYTETANGYTLDITNGTNMYTGARDATGNSCIKLGTSSKAGSFTFTVPDNVTSVVIHVAAYKAKTATVDINGTKTVLTTKSDNGQYDAITVDTSVTKTVSLAVSSGYRAMVNSIEFVSCGHEYDVPEITEATCLDKGSIADICKNCRYTETTDIDATGHTYENGVCTECGTSETHVCSYEAVVTAPTCTEAGYTTYTCSCGDTYKTDDVDALGHLYDEEGWYITTEATYVANGEQRNDCTRDNCDHYNTKVIEVLVATTPEEIVNEAYELAVGEKLSLGYKYTLSGNIVSIDTEFNPSYNNVTVTIKVAGADEAKTIKCYRLKGTGADKIDVGDFITVKGSIIRYSDTVVEFEADCTIEYHECRWIDATCSAAKHCAICGTTEGSALDHTPGEEASCTTDQICTVCETVLVKAGHNFGEGGTDATCSVCGEVNPNAGETPIVPAKETFTADFNTVTSTNTSYVQSTTTSGWVATNCAVFKGGTSNSSPAFTALGDASTRGFALNGKTSAKGTIVSPTLSNGVSKITLNYTNVFSESNGVDITITVKQNGVAVATKKIDNNSVTQYTSYEVIWDLEDEGVAVTGDFTIEITNNSPSNSTKNKDRVCIWNLQWTNNPTN